MLKKKPELIACCEKSKRTPIIKNDEIDTHNKLEVLLYYENFDQSNNIYHPEYLKFFERAREHTLGQQRLVDLFYDGKGFVVTASELIYKGGAKFGDILEIRTKPELLSKYRIGFVQQIFCKNGKNIDLPLVLGRVEMVCVDNDGKIIPLPDIVLSEMKKQYNVEL